MGLSRLEQSRRLAAAIREGVARAEILKDDGVNIQENPQHFLTQRFPANGTWWACAIGHAVLGMSGEFEQACGLVHMVWTSPKSNDDKHRNTRDMNEHFACLLGVDATLVQMVDNVQREDHRNIASMLPDLDKGTLSFMWK